MAETVNVSDVAPYVAHEIFGHFRWNAHPLSDQNFPCVTESHKTEGKTDKQKKTHPADAVFFYEDPYTGRRRYLLTDFKSYGKDTITSHRIRAALRSLGMAVECARVSSDWRSLYSINVGDDFDLHGFLFVYNHDNKFGEDFDKVIGATNLSTIDIASNVYVHYMGPSDVNRLWSIANDLIRLQHEKRLPTDYSFFHPDLFLVHRHGDVWEQPATIEMLMAPYIVIKYKSAEKRQGGYLIYYNRSGSTVEEFEYFLDSLSRFQLLTSDDFLRVRVAHKFPDEKIKSNFQAAINKYAKAWGFDQDRQQVLENIAFEPVTSVTSAFNPGNLGWRDR